MSVNEKELVRSKEKNDAFVEEKSKKILKFDIIFSIVGTIIGELVWCIIAGGIENPDGEMFAIAGVGAGFFVLVLLFRKIIIKIAEMIKNIFLVVTDKRVYGCGLFNRQVDLPIDSISAVEKSVFKSLKVATSSGKIAFYGIENRDELYNAINELLITRQSGNTRQSNTYSDISQIKVLKELLDSGAITQEEFEQKKKEFLK